MSEEQWEAIARKAIQTAQSFLDSRDCTCDDAEDGWDDCWYRYTPQEKWEELIWSVKFHLMLEFA